MAEEITAPVTHNYKSQANVRVEFYDTAKSSKGEFGSNQDFKDSGYWQLFGFLTDEGLDLGLTNKFKNALDFGFFEAAQALGAGLKGLAGAVGESEQYGYIKGGIGNSNIILNAPYYWQGTDPINLGVSLYQIADNEKDIIENYQRIMEILSPTMGIPEGGAESVTLAGNGPGLVYVHYFPKDGVGSGKIVFGPCLCEKVSMKVKPPYNSQYMPIIGEYTFNLLVSRIIDRTQIAEIFGNSSPNSTNKTGNNS